ncbi:MAG TPA: molybdenum cofactor guanylyltransferase, partial [Anaerolineales bacterium]|nr:molybdenum cofactor guanylyltransferase [Anaerolineales bacterium]
ALLQGKPLVQHITEKLALLTPHHLLITNHPGDYAWLGWRIVSDTLAGQGALVGLQTALQAVQTDWLIYVACDMPFVSLPLLRYQMDQIADADVVIPIWQDDYQPMHALYRRATCQPLVEAAIQAGKKRMIAFHTEARVRRIEPNEISHFDPQGRCFFNINTPAELTAAQNLF